MPTLCTSRAWLRLPRKRPQKGQRDTLDRLHSWSSFPRCISGRPKSRQASALQGSAWPQSCSFLKESLRDKKMGVGWGQSSGPTGPTVAHQGTQVHGSEALRRSGGGSSRVLTLPSLCLFRTPLASSFLLSPLLAELESLPHVGSAIHPSSFSSPPCPAFCPASCYPGRVKLDALPALQTVWNSLNALTLGLYRMAERQFTG